MNMFLSIVTTVAVVLLVLQVLVLRLAERVRVTR